MRDDFYKNQLSAQARQYYEIILRCCRAESGACKFRLPVRASNRDDSMKAGFDAVKALRADHPEYFWISGEYTGVLYSNHMTIESKEIYTVDQTRRLRGLLREYLNRVTAGTEGMTVPEKERVIYGRIAMLEYKNNGEAHDHNVVSGLLKGTAVCEGYTCMLVLALRHAGIPAIKVSGFTEEPHCWAIAWINDSPVHLDVTWDSTSSGRPRYRYFNLSDAEIAQDHRIDADGIPACADSSYSGRRLSAVVKGHISQLALLNRRYVSKSNK